jgi:hypothetical protein
VSAPRAEEESEADAHRDAESGEPDLGGAIEIEDREDEIPNEVAAEDHAAGIELREVFHGSRRMDGRMKPGGRGSRKHACRAGIAEWE